MRRSAWIVLLLLAAVAAAVVAVLATRQKPTHARANRTTTRTATAPHTTAPAPRPAPRHPPATPIPAGNSIVAYPRTNRIAVFARANGRRPVRILRNPLWDGARLVFLVDSADRVWRWPRWVRVHLPIRPNGSTGWVRSRDLRFLRDPFRVSVSLRRHHLDVYEGTRHLLGVPVGVGRSVTPTPLGRYFIIELIRQRDPGGPYGPFAFGTSAYSNVLQTFGGGPGQIGIHGTDEPAAIGTDVSHGCIRMTNANIRMLARLLPLGTPVDIRA